MPTRFGQNICWKMTRNARNVFHKNKEMLKSAHKKHKEILEKELKFKDYEILKGDGEKMGR